MDTKHHWYGKQHTKETKKKMAESRRKFWTSGKRSKASESRRVWAKDPIKSKKWLEAVKGIDRSYMLTDEYRKKISDIKKGIILGSKNPRWNGHNIKLLVRKSLERDGYTCQDCGLRDEEIMQVDHIVPRRVAPERYLDLTNLRSLCPNCHTRKTLRDIEVYGKNRVKSKRSELTK